MAPSTSGGGGTLRQAFGRPLPKPHVSTHVRNEACTGVRKPRSRQKALGHASIRTTIDTYTHLDLEDVALAVEAMDKIQRGSQNVPLKP